MYYSDPKFWFSYEGRINRRPYFFGGLAAAIFTEGSKLVHGIYALGFLPFVVVAVYVAVVLGIKRCHDRGKPGWFILVNFIPVVCLWPMIELTFFKGDEGPNKYGPDPLQPEAAASPAAEGA